MGRDIGIDVKEPEKKCNDRNCPFHGNLSVRGKIFDGIVVSNKMQKSAIVKRERLFYVKKYERYEKRTSKFHVHIPECISADIGDKVKIMECRPLSKTISFVIVEVGK